MAVKIFYLNKYLVNIGLKRTTRDKPDKNMAPVPGYDGVTYRFVCFWEKI